MSDETKEEPATSNVGDRFDRLPATDTERSDPGRPTRRAVLDWWEQRFGVPPSTFDRHTFWEKGAGKIWALNYELSGPIRIEALGMPVLRTRQEHWKPTTDAVQRFGHLATRNVIELDEMQARRFLAGETQEVSWDGDWGYLIGSHGIGGAPAPIGVGLYTYGELKSTIPKGRRRTFSD